MSRARRYFVSAAAFLALPILAGAVLLGAIGLAIATTLARAVRAARSPLDRTASATHAAPPIFSHRLHSKA
jgi:hypothetical protein